MAEDKPIIIDLDRAIIGRWKGKKAHTGDPGMVYPEYAPFNSFFKTTTYKDPIKESNIFTIYPKNSDDGTPESVVVIYEGTKDGIAAVLNSKLQKRIQELEDQIEDLKLEVSTYKQRAEAAQKGAKKQVAEAEELRQGTKRRGPSWGGRFGDDMF